MRSFFLCSLLFSSTFAQSQEKHSATQPAVHYILNIDTARHLVNVEMRLHITADTFRLAMFAHPEYDDRFWRYVKNLRVENGNVSREDSAVWCIKKPALKPLFATPYNGSVLKDSGRPGNPFFHQPAAWWAARISICMW